MKRIYQLVNDERTDEQLMEIAMHIQQQQQRKKRKLAEKERKQLCSVANQKQLVTLGGVACNNTSRAAPLPRRQLWLSTEDLFNLSHNNNRVMPMDSTDGTYKSLLSTTTSTTC
jgi:hypothetical protein